MNELVALLDKFDAGDIVTVYDYWDCECDKDYIHYKGNTTYCNRCKRHEYEMPDSRLEEVLERRMYGNT